MITEKKMVQMTEEEYIQYELNADIRHEYVNGQLIDMPGENGYNNQIAMNFVFLSHSLKREGYKPYAHDVKVKVSGTDNYFYPDFFLSKEICNLEKYVYTKPVLIMEVLSPSTKKIDAIDKYLQYRRIPELQYYLLVEPSKKIVQVISRVEADDWRNEYFTLLDEQVNLPAINLSFSLKDLFE